MKNLQTGSPLHMTIELVCIYRSSHMKIWWMTLECTSLQLEFLFRLRNLLAMIELK